VLRATGLALLVLVVIAALLGPTVALLPLQWLRLVVGVLLLLFGLQWLRKAILRAGGRKALSDENARFRRTIDRAGARAAEVGADPLAFAMAFKSVLLEGLEIVFIVVTFGASAHQVPVAAAAAVAAVVVVGGIAAVIRGPLARVPENTLKFVVGVMLTGFGTFWAVEGTGAVWPGDEIALPVVIVAVAAVALAAVAILRALPRRSRPAAAPREERPPSRARTIGRLLYEYLAGDDWAVALVVGAGIAAAFLLLAGAPVWAWCALPIAVVATLPLGLARAQR
jgi:uncharacterized membrane protein